MLKASILLIFVALVSVEVAQKCLAGPLIEQTVKVDQKIKQLVLEFEEKVENLFTKQQQLGDKLIKNGETSGYALKRISNVFTIIEIFTYTIRRHSLEVAKQIINGSGGLEAAKQMPGERNFGELLEERAVMRGLVDCFQFTVFPWKLMYKYVSHYVTKAEKVTDELKSLTESIFREMKKFDQLGDLSFKRFGEQLAFKKITDENELKVRLDFLDKLIDNAVDCSQCSGLVEHDRDFYNVYPIFASEENVVKAVEQYIDQDLLSSVLDSNLMVQDHLLSFSPQEVETVDFEDVESTRDRMAGEENDGL